MNDNIHEILRDTEKIIHNAREILFKILENDNIPLIIRADILSEGQYLCSNEPLNWGLNILTIDDASKNYSIDPSELNYEYLDFMVKHKYKMIYI